MTEGEFYQDTEIITCPHCARQWVVLDSDTGSARRRWGVLNAIRADENLTDGPVHGDRCYYCAPNVAAEKLDDVALGWLQSNQKGFSEVLKAYIIDGRSDTERQQCRRMIIDWLLTDQDFRDIATWYLKESAPASYEDAAREEW